MERLYPQPVDVRELSPLTLALVGDGVYELMVRERLCCLANRAAGELHRLSVRVVRAEAQAAAAERIEPLLTETPRQKCPHPAHRQGLSHGDGAGNAFRLSVSERRDRPRADAFRRMHGNINKVREGKFS